MLMMHQKDNTWVHLQRHDAQDPYGPQDNQDPHRKKPDNVDVEPATMMQPDLDHHTLQPWTPRCALDGPKWNDHDLFQAILLRGQKVLLTTYSQNRGEYLDPIDELQTPSGPCGAIPASTDDRNVLQHHSESTQHLLWTIYKGCTP